jgi:hypothetical protein
MVGGAMVIAALVGARVPVPAEVPGVALQAVAVYRLEVGGAIFVGLYVITMAFVLALQNRAFTEIGTGGRVCVTIETRDSPIDVAEKGDRRAREERVRQLIEEARGLLSQNQVVFDRWRAEGILPPKEPRDRV